VAKWYMGGDCGRFCASFVGRSCYYMGKNKVKTLIHDNIIDTTNSMGSKISKIGGCLCLECRVDILAVLFRNSMR